MSGPCPSPETAAAFSAWSCTIWTQRNPKESLSGIPSEGFATELPLGLRHSGLPEVLEGIIFFFAAAL